MIFDITVNKKQEFFVALVILACIVVLFLLIAIKNTPSILYSTEIVDDSGASMVLVPSSPFIMGSEAGDVDERPAITLNMDSFYIDKYEVTNGAYQECVDNGMCVPDTQSYEFYRTVYFSSNDEEFYKFPVVYVNWYMAKNFCEWRNSRLPTEAEWEKAARGPNGRIYPWGNEFKTNLVKFSGDWWPEAVGSHEKGRSIYGVYDMAGNVQEWVSSLYMPYPYRFLDGRENMTSNEQRVQRGGGGAWAIYRTSRRTHYYPINADATVGFRCARSTP